jgi:FkbM family methyltransferase
MLSANQIAKTWPPPLPSVAKRCVRFAVRHSPEPVRGLVARVPLSRFATVASRLFWGAEPMRWKDCEVEVNPGELHGYFAYFLNAYANEEIRALTEACRGAQRFADVGANIGLVTLAVAQACPQLETFAFEPEPAVASRFRRNIARNPEIAARVRFHELAICDAPGELAFTSGDHSSSETGRLAEDSDLAGSTRVLADRLDNLFAPPNPPPDVVKIDVEGAELRVLAGMSGLFARGAPRVMVIEVHGGFFGQGAEQFQCDVHALLEGAGYLVERLTGRGWQADDPRGWPERCHIRATRRS